jgi:hypothetical protein
MMDDTWKAWAAGFFDGEGTTCMMGRGVMMSIQQCDREPLDRFKEIMGMGVIYGPYEYKDGRRPRYEWRIHGLAKSTMVIDIMMPWLGTAKREQAARTFKKFEDIKRTHSRRTKTREEVLRDIR